MRPWLEANYAMATAKKAPAIPVNQPSNRLHRGAPSGNPNVFQQSDDAGVEVGTLTQEQADVSDAKLTFMRCREQRQINMPKPASRREATALTGLSRAEREALLLAVSAAG